MKKSEKKFDSHLGKFQEDGCRRNLFLRKGKKGEGKRILSAEREKQFGQKDQQDQVENSS